MSDYKPPVPVQVNAITARAQRDIAIRAAFGAALAAKYTKEPTEPRPAIPGERPTERDHQDERRKDIEARRAATGGLAASMHRRMNPSTPDHQ